MVYFRDAGRGQKDISSVINTKDIKPSASTTASNLSKTKADEVGRHLQ